MKEDEKLFKEMFNMLWDLSPPNDDPAHSYDKTMLVLKNILWSNPPYVTPKGEEVTFELIYERYKRHVTVKNALNDGVEAKYRKKENQVKPLHPYLVNLMFFNIDKIPETNRHFYFWHDKTPDEITSMYEKFLKISEE